MGPSISTTYNLNQSITNSLIQSQKTQCGVSQNVNISGNTISVINGDLSSVDVGINVSNQQADATCIMTNTMAAQVEAIMESQFQQTASLQSGLLDFLKTDNIKITQDTTQRVSNIITQITQSTCNVDQNTNINNNYIFFTGKNSDAYVGINVSGQTAKSSCAMTNYTTADLSGNLRAQGNQSSKITNPMGLFITVFLVIAIIVCIALVISGFLRRSKKKKESEVATEGDYYSTGDYGMDYGEDYGTDYGMTTSPEYSTTSTPEYNATNYGNTPLDYTQQNTPSSVYESFPSYPQETVPSQ